MEICFTYGPLTKSRVRDLLVAGATSARLTFSFGKVETQLARAEEIRQEADNLGQEVKILGELEGPKIRIGKFSDHSDDSILVKSGEIVQFLGLEDYRTDSTPTQIPISKFDVDRYSIGSYIAYGENDPGFQVVDVAQNVILAKCMFTCQIYATKSLTVLGHDTPDIDLDYHNIQQLNYMCKHTAFDGIVVPAIRSFAAFQSVQNRVRSLNPSIEIWSKIERRFNKAELLKLVGASSGVIVDRNEIGYSLAERDGMPQAVHDIINACGDLRHKILIASQIATSRSTKERGQLSAAELCDAWNTICLDVGGFLLTEETAFNESGVEVVSQLSSLGSIRGR